MSCSIEMPEASITPDPAAHPLKRIGHALVQRPLVSALGFLALVSLVFLLVPGLDLSVSRLFYVPATGFAEGRSPAFEAWRELGTVVEWAFGIAVTAPLLIKIAMPETRLLVRPRVTVFVLTVFALGPELIVNGILKEHWGRARPRAVLEFGGDAIFSPAWWISDQCARNCSFVSGEAAAAFWLVALVFIARREQRAAIAVFTLSFAAIVSLARIAVGAHFLSDVLIAWLLTLCVITALDLIVLKGLPENFDSTTETAAGRIGAALRRLIRNIPSRKPDKI
jgi:membrane-associated PAP2 superfamily phosphatase